MDSQRTFGDGDVAAAAAAAGAGLGAGAAGGLLPGAGADPRPTRYRHVCHSSGRVDRFGRCSAGRANDGLSLVQGQERELSRRRTALYRLSFE